jgi:hyperosmotically inducible protein
MHPSRILTVAFVSLTLAVQAVGASPTGAERPEQNATTGLADAWLTAKTKIALFSEPRVKGTQVRVETTDGIVTLTGKVDSETARATAATVARSIDGVKRVRNHLQVVAPAERPAVEATDRDITRRVEDILTKEGHLRAVQVRADRGVVLLTGRVPNIGASARASEIARGVPGVRSVKNELTYELADRQRDRSVLAGILLLAAMSRTGTISATRERGADGGVVDSEDGRSSVRPRSGEPGAVRQVEGKIARLADTGRQVTIEDGTVLTIPSGTPAPAALRVGTMVRASYRESEGRKLVTTIAVSPMK